MKHRDLDLSATDYTKLHAAAFVETAVQTMLTTPDLDQQFTNLRESPGGLKQFWPGDNPNEAYARAKREQQIAFALAGCMIAPTMFNSVITHYNQTGSIHVPEHFDTHPTDKLGNSLYDQAVRDSTYWWIASAHETWHELADAHHPHHRLIYHIQQARNNYYDTLLAWKENGNENRWPDTNKDHIDQLRKQTGANHLSEDIPFVNGVLSLDLIAANAMRMILQKPSISKAEIVGHSRSAVLPLSWGSSIDRHVGWSRDWRTDRLHGKPVGISVDGAAQVLSTYDGDIQSLQTFAEDRPHMATENICPHASIRTGPWKKSGACTGSVRVYLPDQAKVKHFFNAMEVEPPHDGKIDTATIFLALGSRAVEEMMTANPYWQT